MKFTVFKLLILIPLLLFSQTVDPVYITLNGDITNPDQEISGLAWYNENLILLPQYPSNNIYAIPKEEILEFLDSLRTTILPQEIGWESFDLEKSISGFEGYEAIIFYDDTVYVTVEAEKRQSNTGFIVRGIVDHSTNEIRLNREKLIKIETPVTLKNMTYETLLLSDRSINTIYEVNSTKVNRKPIYYQFDTSLGSHSVNPFPFTEYRITDATEIDKEGRFWVTNYFWPGDTNLLKPDFDYEITSQKDIKPVERLLEFQITGRKIVRTATAPINIRLSEFGDSRNWEGIARLDNRGFLIVTDKFPGTILGFIPISD